MLGLVFLSIRRNLEVKKGKDWQVSYMILKSLNILFDQENDK